MTCIVGEITSFDADHASSATSRVLFGFSSLTEVLFHETAEHVGSLSAMLELFMSPATSQIVGKVPARVSVPSINVYTASAHVKVTTSLKSKPRPSVMTMQNPVDRFCQATRVHATHKSDCFEIYFVKV